MRNRWDLDVEVTCPTCDGDGCMEYEKAVVDWERGGYLVGQVEPCHECNGNGVILVEREEDD